MRIGGNFSHTRCTPDQKVATFSTSSQSKATFPILAVMASSLAI